MSVILSYQNNWWCSLNYLYVTIHEAWSLNLVFYEFLSFIFSFMGINFKRLPKIVVDNLYLRFTTDIYFVNVCEKKHYIWKRGLGRGGGLILLFIAHLESIFSCLATLFKFLADPPLVVSSRFTHVRASVCQCVRASVYS